VITIRDPRRVSAKRIRSHAVIVCTCDCLSLTIQLHRCNRKRDEDSDRERERERKREREQIEINFYIICIIIKLQKLIKLIKINFEDNIIYLLTYITVVNFTVNFFYSI